MQIVYQRLFIQLQLIIEKNRVIKQLGTTSTFMNQKLLYKNF